MGALQALDQAVCYKACRPAPCRPAQLKESDRPPTSLPWVRAIADNKNGQRPHALPSPHERVIQTYQSREDYMPNLSRYKSQYPSYPLSLEEALEAISQKQRIEVLVTDRGNTKSFETSSMVYKEVPIECAPNSGQAQFSKELWFLDCKGAWGSPFVQVDGYRGAKLL